MMLAQGARILDVMVRSIIIARILNLNDFGAYAIIMAFTALMTEIIHLNFGSMILTYGAKFEKLKSQDKLKALLKTGYIATFIVGAFAVCIISTILHFGYDAFVKAPDILIPVIVLSAASAVNCFDGVNKAILRLLDKFRISCLMDLVAVILNIAIVLAIFNMAEDTITTAIYATAFCIVFLNIIGTVVTLAILRQYVSQWWKAPISALQDEAGEIFKLAFSNSVASSVQRLMRKGDVVLLGFFAPTAAVGLYDVGKKLAAMALLGRDAVALAAFPQISRAMAANQKTRLKNLILRLFKVGVPVAVAALLALYVIGPFLIGTLYGEKYIQATPILVILTVTSFYYLLFFWANALLLNAGRAKAIIFTNLAGLIALIIAGTLLTPLHQATGMAISVVIGVSVQFLSIAWVTRQVLRADTVLGTAKRSSTT